MTLNPYESPVTPLAIESFTSQATYNAGTDLLRVWERRRLWFNAILTAETLLIGIFQNQVIILPRFWVLAVEGAFVANVGFCVGPVITWYLSWLGLNYRAVSTLLFVAGTGLAMVLALVSILVNFVPWS